MTANTNSKIVKDNIEVIRSNSKRLFFFFSDLERMSLSLCSVDIVKGGQHIEIAGCEAMHIITILGDA